METIVLATGNPHKVRELRALFGASAAVMGLDELGGGVPAEPEESGRTFAENARIKATAYARATGRLCLADDSGLEVDALGGRPGVISSHYATDGRETGLTREARDAANLRRVLDELRGTPEVARGARFVCVMALAEASGRVVAEVRGVCEGRIGIEPDVPRGSGGFGYDPVFLVAPDFARTSAELDAEAKNAVSHRGAAARLMLAEVRRLFPAR